MNNNIVAITAALNGAFTPKEDGRQGSPAGKGNRQRNCLSGRNNGRSLFTVARAQKTRFIQLTTYSKGGTLWLEKTFLCFCLL